MKRVVYTVALALLATGCASVRKAPPAFDQAAKEFRTTPGKSNVYVFRDEVLGSAVKMSVVLDGRMLGDTGPKSFLLTTVEPGSHLLVSKSENDARLEFTAEPGKNVYVWQEMKVGLLSARSRLELVDEALARPRILECSLLENDLAPTPATPPTATAGAAPGM